MKRLIVVLLLSLPIYTFATSDKKQQAKETENSTEVLTTFKGTIGDMANYQPLSDVTLTISAHDADFKKVVKTDAEGKFQIENLPSGLYKVKFEKKGYEPGTYQSLVIQEGSTHNFGFLLYEK